MSHKDLSLPENKLNTAQRQIVVKNRMLPILLAMLVGFGLLQLLIVAWRPLVYDEGVFLETSRLIGRGFTPYQEVFTLASPLFVQLLSWFSYSKLSVEAIQFIFLLFSLFFLINLTILARFFLGTTAAIVAVFLAATTVTFMSEASAVLPVIPALSLGLFALVLLARYLTTDAPGWLLLSGWVWGLALWLAPAVLTMGLFALLCLWFYRRKAMDGSEPVPASKPLQPILLWLAGSVIALGLGLLVFSPELIGPLLRNHLTIRQNMPFVQGENFRMIGQFLSFDIFLAILALIGIAHIYDRPQDPLWLVFIWALSSGMWLMLRAMPRGSEAAVLLAPVALLAGQGGLVVGQQFKALWGQNRETGRSTRPGFLVMGVLGFIFFLGFSWQQFDGYNLREIDTAGDLNQYQQRPAIAAFVREHSAPDDCVLIDDPTMAVAADRLPTPNLVGLTPERVLGGLISEAEIIDLTQQANCKLVLFYRRDYHRHLMAFQAWAEDNFPNEHSSFENTKIYFK